MKVAIFGATGGTGIELVKQALDRGHLVTAFVREPSPLADKGDGLKIMNGDIYDMTGVARCVQGQDAVLCALGARDLNKTIIRPNGLVDSLRTGAYNVGENIRARKSRIARADVADLILNELEEGSLVHKAVTITN